MPLHDRFDYLSLLTAFIALVLITMIVFGRPALLVALALILGTVLFSAGIFVNIRETVPSYKRLLGIYCGVFGFARFVSEGWGIESVGLVLIGVGFVLELVYEHMTGRSADII